MCCVHPSSMYSLPIRSTRAPRGDARCAAQSCRCSACSLAVFMNAMTIPEGLMAMALWCVVSSLPHTGHQCHHCCDWAMHQMIIVIMLLVQVMEMQT